MRRRKEVRPGFNKDGACLDIHCSGSAKRRLNAFTGELFYGCTAYPLCRNTQKVFVKAEAEFPDLNAFVPLVADR